ncbi:uncharacterized protein LOC143033592 [Oratosquilla oratoria]|uniref:uncharacterized protein LOC143033592 n=1 Tax=Oratosquilla oratoria TaxID=337810 RepID=UPI003F75E57B
MIKGTEATTKLVAAYNSMIRQNRNWKISVTKLIPKTQTPHIKDLRPIALLDTSYKTLMGIIKEVLEKHLHQSQNLLTKRRIAGNIFMQQYIITENDKNKKPLIVIPIDFTKAFDSADRMTSLPPCPVGVGDPQCSSSLSWFCSPSWILRLRCLQRRPLRQGQPSRPPALLKKFEVVDGEDEGSVLAGRRRRS